MNDEIQIGDMYFASALLAYGADLVRVDKSDPKRQKFCFADAPLAYIIVLENDVVVRVEKPTIETAENRFFARKLCLPPNYSDAVRRIKTAIYS